MNGTGRGYPLRIGLKLSQDASIESFRGVWRIADEARFDHCWAFDHLATRGPNGVDRTVFEGWTLLAAMAEATKHTRIGLLVTGMVYRHPALLAKAAVTVDHISGGRLEFGIGAGWAALEQQMYGIDPSHGVGRLSEGLQVVTRLWMGDRTNFEGRYYQLRDAVANPTPIQRPHPPIWIGAGGPAVLRVVAQYADVWNAAGDGIEAARTASLQLVGACNDIGRDPSTIRWSTQLTFDGADPAATLDELHCWREAGFSEIVIYCAGADPVRTAEIAADKILPAARRDA